MSTLLVVLGAAVGAPLRFLLASRLDGRLPWGTFVVNVSGSFLLGVFSALALSAHAAALLGTGFCGAFTTYSAFAVQTRALGRWAGTAYAGATVVVALAACTLGFVLAS